MRINRTMGPMSVAASAAAPLRRDATVISLTPERVSLEQIFLTAVAADARDEQVGPDGSAQTAPAPKPANTAAAAGREAR